PLGGTTGWFCTEPTEEIIWDELDGIFTKDVIFKKLDAKTGEVSDLTLKEKEVKGFIAKEYARANKLLTLGAWDEMQVAEDYMLGLMLWWSGANVPNFYTLTSEDVGAASFLEYEVRAAQTSRWNKGCIIGLLVILGEGKLLSLHEHWFKNLLTLKWNKVLYSELYHRKGLWGTLSFISATLSSAIFPMMFRLSMIFAVVWWLQYIPIGLIGNFKVGINWLHIGSLAAGLNTITGIGPFISTVFSWIQTNVPQCLNFLPIGWDWGIGAAISVSMVLIHAYYTVLSIFNGPDDKKGFETAKDMIKEFKGKIRKYCSYVEFKQNIDVYYDASGKKCYRTDAEVNRLLALENNKKYIKRGLKLTVDGMSMKKFIDDLTKSGVPEERERLRETMKKALVLSYEELEHMEGITKKGALSNLALLTGGKEAVSLVSFTYWLGVKSLIFGLLVGIVALGFNTVLATLMIGAGAAMANFLWSVVVAHIYVNVTNDEELRGIRAMRVRLAAINAFIPFYHMLYLFGNKMAWSEIGPRIGYWWLTVRAAQIDEEITKGYREKFMPTVPELVYFDKGVFEKARWWQPWKWFKHSGFVAKSWQRLKYSGWKNVEPNETVQMQIDSVKIKSNQRLQVHFWNSLMFLIFFTAALGFKNDLVDVVVSTKLKQLTNMGLVFNNPTTLWIVGAMFVILLVLKIWSVSINTGKLAKVETGAVIPWWPQGPPAGTVTPILIGPVNVGGPAIVGVPAQASPATQKSDEVVYRGWWEAAKRIAKALWRYFTRQPNEEPKGKSYWEDQTPAILPDFASETSAELVKIADMLEKGNDTRTDFERVTAAVIELLKRAETAKELEHAQGENGSVLFLTDDIVAAKLRDALKDNRLANGVVFEKLGLDAEMVKTAEKTALVQVFNEILKMHDFYSKIGVDKYVPLLSAEINQLLDKVKKADPALTDQDYSRLNMALLEVIYPFEIRKKRIDEIRKQVTRLEFISYAIKYPTCVRVVARAAVEEFNRSKWRQEVIRTDAAESPMKTPAPVAVRPVQKHIVTSALLMAAGIALMGYMDHLTAHATAVTPWLMIGAGRIAAFLLMVMSMCTALMSMKPAPAAQPAQQLPPKPQTHHFAAPRNAAVLALAAFALVAAGALIFVNPSINVPVFIGTFWESLAKGVLGYSLGHKTALLTGAALFGGIKLVDKSNIAY
ncbi:MAG: hypothetical protein HQL28_02985, partial [Candidatus Omnitrophica bacterium]|nr:hypothetical protein [Candidatus Omnitrophota bacterium]